MSVRVLIADDQALVRAGFRRLRESEPGIEVVGEAQDGLEALDIADRFTTDIVPMDIRMPRLDGLQATRRLLERHARTRVIILTTYDLDEYVFDAIKAGASGFLLGESRPQSSANRCGCQASLANGRTPQAARPGAFRLGGMSGSRAARSAHGLALRLLLLSTTST
jgi:DNA-binding NarL/FixJ family response regulator